METDPMTSSYAKDVPAASAETSCAAGGPPCQLRENVTASGEERVSPFRRDSIVSPFPVAPRARPGRSVVGRAGGRSPTPANAVVRVRHAVEECLFYSFNEPTALGEAARHVVSRLDLQPGQVTGASVNTKVVLPIIDTPHQARRSPGSGTPGAHPIWPSVR
jgi:hypothetical protein